MSEEAEGVELARKELEQAMLERAEWFPEADAAMKGLETATRQLETFVVELRTSAKDLSWMREDAAAKVKDWASNLVPGAQAAKELMDWVRNNLLGSLKYSSAPYSPTSFEAVRQRLTALAGMEKAAIDLKLTDALRTNQRAVTAAEEAMQRSLEGMSLADQLAFAELQQKISDLNEKISA